MKLNLVVLTPGKWEKKVIPITNFPFLIGRDAHCHLRPASAVISKRHCALIAREGRFFVRDFDSTNGTAVNNQRVKVEHELRNQDCLQVGPLLFGVRVETSTPVNEPTPLSLPRFQSGMVNEESAAALLLDDNAPPPGSPGIDPSGVPTGSTVLEILAQPPEEAKREAEKAAKAQQAAKASADTSTAAKAILDKYLRRPRGQ